MLRTKGTHWGNPYFHKRDSPSLRVLLHIVNNLKFIICADALVDFIFCLILNSHEVEHQDRNPIFFERVFPL